MSSEEIIRDYQAKKDKIVQMDPKTLEKGMLPVSLLHVSVSIISLIPVHLLRSDFSSNIEPPISVWMKGNSR
jgi:hypothetical protein